LHGCSVEFGLRATSFGSPRPVLTAAGHPFDALDGPLEHVRHVLVTFRQQSVEGESAIFRADPCDQRCLKVEIMPQVRANAPGNSIGQDRRFIARYMPELDRCLHYRSIDVSTIKELVRRWYPQERAPQKKEGHRALDDILESLEELRFYRRSVFRVP
jgi:hypothetical protein